MTKQLSDRHWQHSIVILLDLSSDFDTVDHSVLITQLKKGIGINDLALDWLISYLFMRSFSVMLQEVFTCCSLLWVSLGTYSGSPFMYNFLQLNDSKPGIVIIIPLDPSTSSTISNLLSSLGALVMLPKRPGT